MTREPTARTTLITILRKKNWTVSFAESCTGGRLSAMVAEVPGVSDIFLGSVVSYANQVKKDLLGVRNETLQGFGAVSEECAREMARGAVQSLKSHVAVAITGIAGPTGGTPTKPVGMVCFAAVGPGFEAATTRRFEGDRVAIQEQSADYAMQFLREQMERAS